MTSKNSKKPRPSSQVSSNEKKNSVIDNPEIAAIDKLLKAAAELMKRTRGIDKQAYEHLRRLRVTVRFAMSAGAPQNFNYAPIRAPKKWSDRQSKQEGPVDFIKREYAPWLERKSISRADIRKLDRQLYVALYNWMAKHGDIDTVIDLPTLSENYERKLEEAGKDIKAPSRLLRVSELPLEEREQLRLYKLAHRRKERRIK